MAKDATKNPAEAAATPSRVSSTGRVIAGLRARQILLIIIPQNSYIIGLIIRRDTLSGRVVLSRSPSVPKFLQEQNGCWRILWRSHV